MDASANMTGWKSEIDQNFGSIVEGIHIAGYTLERALRKLEWVLVDDRWKTVGDGYEDVHEFIDTVRLDSFMLIAEQRKKIAAKIKKLAPEVSNREVGKVLGVSEATVRRDTASNDAPAEKKASKVKAPKGPPASNDAPPPTAVVESSSEPEKEEGIEDRINGEDPENYRTAFLLRADQAVRFASYSGPKKYKAELAVQARQVVAAWTALAEQLESDDGKGA